MLSGLRTPPTGHVCQAAAGVVCSGPSLAVSLPCLQLCACYCLSSADGWLRVPSGQSLWALSAATHWTACRYIHTFQQGFDAGLKDVQLAFMQSDGGLSQVDLFSGHKAILSGPAGG